MRTLFAKTDNYGLLLQMNWLHSGFGIKKKQTVESKTDDKNINMMTFIHLKISVFWINYYTISSTFIIVLTYSIFSASNSN